MINEEYLIRLLDRYGSSMLRLACTYLKNRADAEDAVQDVFLKLVQKQPHFNDENHEKAYLLKATANVCRNKLLLFWYRNVGSIDDEKELCFTDEYDSDSCVFEAVMKLPVKFRTVVHLYYYEGYKTAEIANLLGKSDAAVRSDLHRARKQLKDMLKEAYDFE